MVTDEAGQYHNLNKAFAEHGFTRYVKGEYVSAENPTIHPNTSIFKRGMKGVYQHCFERHLRRYLAEFDFRNNSRIALGVDDQAHAGYALRPIVGKRLTYQTVGR